MYTKLKTTTMGRQFNSKLSEIQKMRFDYTLNNQRFNATFNNISVISWRSVLLLEETGVPREYHRPTASLLINLIT